MHRFGLPILALLLVLPGPEARAAVEVQLPLEGYHRPGKYMPVRITVPPGTTGDLIIESAQAISTAVSLSDATVSAVAPLLPIDSIRQARWRVGDGPWQALQANWRPLDPDDRLVGFTSIDMPLARELYPGQNIIPLRLDPSRPLPGPVVAWEALDLLVLDNPSLLDDQLLGQLLGAQVSVAVRSDVPPDLRWPWRQAGHYWVVSYEVAGPARAAEYPAALAAVQGWRADWPAPFRRRILLYAVGFAALAMGAALLRSRWTPLIIIIIAAGTAGGLAIWWSGRSPVVQRGGQVHIVGEQLAQVDTWIYRATARSAVDRVPFAPLMRPFFEMPEQNLYMRMVLLCDADGRPREFEYRLPPSLRSAFVSRQLGPRTGRFDPEKADGSPLLRLAQRAYLRPRHRVWGLADTRPPDWWGWADAQWWGTLVIEDLPAALRP
jgi:hypothetical protein